jgi:hypothetical protein
VDQNPASMWIVWKSTSGCNPDVDVISVDASKNEKLIRIVLADEELP